MVHIVNPEGQMVSTKRVNFRKSSKRGGGVIFNPKIHVADFGNFKRGFEHEIDKKKSKFRVQGMFFQQFFNYLLENMQPYPL